MVAANVIAYLRCSTEEQHLSPDVQRASIDAWCGRHGLTVAAAHVDLGVSGTLPPQRRPGLMAALSDLKVHKAKHLVIAKRDRLARDVGVAAVIENIVIKGGASIVSADGVGVGDDPAATLMAQIVDAVAQYEGAMIRGRIKSAMAEKRARRERTSLSAPYGYSLTEDGGLVPDEGEQAALRTMLDLRKSGLGYRTIAAALHEAGHQPRGSRWHPTSVARVLKREAEIARRASEV